MVQKNRRIVVAAHESELGGPRILFSLVLTAATLLVVSVGGSLAANGHLPMSLATMVSTSLMAGIVVANGVQIGWEATHQRGSKDR